MLLQTQTCKHQAGKVKNDVVLTVNTAHEIESYSELKFE